METAAKNQGRAEIRKGSNGRIGKNHYDERCIVRNRGEDHAHTHTPNYYVWMQRLNNKEG